MAWHNKNTYGYVRTSSEAIDNATMIYSILSALGWHMKPICAMLGNVEQESGYNPWRWQSEVVLPVGDSRIGYIGGPNTAHAYGLCQQDPAAKYIDRPYAQALPDYAPNYSDRQGGQNDGTAQLQYLHWICSDTSAGEWSNPWGSSYYMPFSQFIVDDTHTVEYLVHTFLVGYERGGWSDTRVTAANYWYNYFSDNPPPTPPDPPTPAGDGTLPTILYMAAKKKKANIIFEKRWYEHK